MNSRDDLPEMAGHSVGDREDRKRFLLSTTVLTVPGTLAAVVVPWWLGWPEVEGVFANEEAATTAERLRFAFTWSFVGFVPYALICLRILQTRLTQGAHNPLEGAEDTALKIHCRAMQNTLEQLIWFVLCIVPVTLCLPYDGLHLVPLVTLGFVFARLAYWWGYFQNGTLGRRYGVQMTFTLNIGLLLLAAALLLS